VTSHQQAGGAIERRAKVIVITLLSDTGVDDHAYPQWPSCWLGRGVQCPLRGQRGGQRGGRACEGGVQAISGGREDLSVVRLDAGAQQAIVVRQRGLHRLWVLLLQPCAALNVGEEKADDALGQIRRMARCWRHLRITDLSARCFDEQPALLGWDL
jgi:hypothetical protein